MKLFIVLALVAVAAAQISNDYLPPHHAGFEDGGAGFGVGSYSAPPATAAVAPVAAYSAPVASFETAASAPAHSFSADDGYRYKTQRRRVVKVARRHRRQVSSEYLPPVASYSEPAPSYAAPAPAIESFEAAGSAPAHSFSADDGYRYKTQRRRVFKTARRHRRQVSSEYLPPVASYSEPAPSYAAPAPAIESFEVAASAPAHSFSQDDGYRYKTQRRRVFKTARRHRRQVSSEYLPPVASYSEPAPSYAAPAPAIESFEVAASAPAHSFSQDDGYRYKTQRRRVFKTARRHRRQVSSEYLPPVASYSEPAPSYAAPAPAIESFEVAASAPAHSFSQDDGYRYKTQRRRVFKTARRHRRQVSSEYLPPVASYSEPAPSYAAPAPAIESFEVAASAPAHSFSQDDGYRYKTQRRRVVKVARRHRRNVSAEYLPPVASNAISSYAAPAPAYSAPAASYAAPVESYDVGASSPGHSFSDADGYRYKTQRRRVIRRHR